MLKYPNRLILNLMINFLYFTIFYILLLPSKSTMANTTFQLFIIVTFRVTSTFAVVIDASAKFALGYLACAGYF